jgi:hypothetical protein
VYAAQPAFGLMLCTSLEYHVLVTLPLWVMSLVLHPLLPLALASLFISAAVCCVAAAQAMLPQNKQKWWSRPLIAALFFFQPMVRGWARYRGRLLLRSAPLAAQQTLDSIALCRSKQPLKLVVYRSPRPVNRFAYVADLLRHLERQGWPVRPDVGWSEHDAEVFGSRWTSLQVTTIAEDFSKGEHILRCRLQPRWSFQAKVLFCIACGLEFLVLGFAAQGLPWLWLLLLLIPLFVWALFREHRTLQSMIIVLLDELGESWELERTQPDAGRAPHKAAVPGLIKSGESPFSVRKNSLPATFTRKEQATP